jgi:hypothetical protein
MDSRDIHESFVLVAGDAARHVPAMAAAVKDAGLRVEAKLELELDAVMAERLLRLVLSVPPPTSSTAAHPHPRTGLAPPHLDTAAAASASAAAAAAASAAASAAETQRRFGAGSTISPGPITPALSLAFTPVRPTVDEVEAYTADGGGGAVTALLIACVDPRADVVARLLALVGSDSAPVASLAPTTFLARFASPAATGITLILAPSHASAASRALHLLREYEIRRQATAAGAASLATASSASAAAALAHQLASVSLGGGGSGSPRSASSGANPLADLAATQRSDWGAAHTSRGPAGASSSKQYLVDMDGLGDFVFPVGQQHPDSTGRLLLFALYGPLTPSGQLTGGKRGGRGLTEPELTSMIRNLEREDLLAVYTGGSVFGDVEGVLVDVSAPTRGYPRMSREQVNGMLADLPRDSRGRCSFHDIQKRVLGSRLQRISDLRTMYPSLTKKTEANETLRIQAPPPAFGRGTLTQKMSLAYGRATTMGARSQSVPHARAPGARPPGPGGPVPSATATLMATTAVGGLDVRVKVGDVAFTRLQEALLHRNAFQIAVLGDAVSPSTMAAVAANTKIVRADLPGALDGFDRTSLFALNPGKGTNVPGSLPRMEYWRPSAGRKR